MAQGFPYQQGFNIAEFLIETVALGASGFGALALDLNKDAPAAALHDFTAYYAASPLCAQQHQAVADVRASNAVDKSIPAGCVQRGATACII